MELNRNNIENKNPKINKTFHFKTQKTNNSANLNFELENENRESNQNLKKTKQFVWISKRDKIIKKDKLKTYHSFEKLNINNYDDLIKLYLKYRNKLVLIDLILCPFLDIGSVILFSISYNLLLKNELQLNSKINYYRIIGIGLSFISIIILTIRRYLYKDLKIIKYILNIKLTYPTSKINSKKLFVEIIFHLLQPYPFITYSKTYYRNGENDFTTIYTIDLFLVVFCFLRLYTILRCVLSLTNYRNIRIWKFYDNSNLYTKTMKKMVQNIPIIFYSIILTIFLFLSSYIFSLLENIKEKEHRNKTYNILWIIFQSIINCGYGDKKIKTFTTKMFMIIIISIGLYLFTSFILSCLKFFDFSSERELKTYQKIKIIYSKNEKRNEYNLYFECYLKYKMTKIKESLISHKSKFSFDNDAKFNISLELKSPLVRNYNNLFLSLNLKNQIKILKDKYYLSILAKLKFEPTISDFFNYIIKRFDVKIDQCNYKTKKYINNISLFHNLLSEGITEYYHNVIEVFYDSNKLTNLMLLMFLTGSQFIINYSDDLIKFKVVQLKDFDVKYKEFKLIYEDRQIKHIRKFGTKNSKYYKDFELYKDFDNISYNEDFDFDDYELDDYYSSHKLSNSEIVNNKKKKNSNGAVDNLFFN